MLYLTIKAQRGEVTCLSSHSLSVVKPKLDHRSSLTPPFGSLGRSCSRQPRLVNSMGVLLLDLKLPLAKKTHRHKKDARQRMSSGLGVSTWDASLNSVPTHCVTLGNSLFFLGPQFPHLWNEGIGWVFLHFFLFCIPFCTQIFLPLTLEE